MNRRVTLLFAAVLMTCVGIVHGGEDAADLKVRGIEALKESQADPAKIIPAAQCFAKASALFEAQGQSELAVEMNSYLFWCRKKMTLQQIDQLASQSENVAVATRLKTVEKIVPSTTPAQTYLDRAEAFAKEHPAEHMLIAIRFFEIAERFKDVDAGRTAMSRTLSEMQQAFSAIPKPVATNSAIPKAVATNPVVAATNPVAFNPVGIWTRMSKNSEINLEIKSDKTVAFIEHGKNQANGTWEMSNGVLTLHFTNKWGSSTCRFSDADSFTEREKNVFKRKGNAESGQGGRNK